MREIVHLQTGQVCSAPQLLSSTMLIKALALDSAVTKSVRFGMLFTALYYPASIAYLRRSGLITLAGAKFWEVVSDEHGIERDGLYVEYLPLFTAAY